MRSETTDWTDMVSLGPGRQRHDVGRAEGHRVGQAEVEVVDVSGPPPRVRQVGVELLGEGEIRAAGHALGPAAAPPPSSSKYSSENARTMHAQTLPPACSSAGAELVSGPPWMRSSMSWIVDQTALSASTLISATDAARRSGRSARDLAGVARRSARPAAAPRRRGAPSVARGEGRRAGEPSARSRRRPPRPSASGTRRTPTRPVAIRPRSAVTRLASGAGHDGPFPPLGMRGAAAPRSDLWHGDGRDVRRTVADLAPCASSPVGDEAQTKASRLQRAGGRSAVRTASLERAGECGREESNRPRPKAPGRRDVGALPGLVADSRGDPAIALRRRNTSTLGQGAPDQALGHPDRRRAPRAGRLALDGRDCRHPEPSARTEGVARGLTASVRGS